MNQRQRTISLFSVTLLAAGGLGVRLFTVSIFQHDVYTAQASAQQHVVRDILPHRGEVFIQDAASGGTVVVAKSVESFGVSATPKDVVHKDQYAQAISEVTGVEKQGILDRFEKGGAYMPVIAHGLNKDQVDQIAAKLNAIERGYKPKRKDSRLNFDAAQGNTLFFIGGVYFTREFKREYPEGSLLGQTLGFVNLSGEGQYGFEEQFNDQLTGYSGKIYLEKDSVGNLLRQSGEVSGSNGTTYELSIDRNVQFLVEQALKEEVERSEAKSGTVVIMDPKTGEIISLANYPSYDPGGYRNLAKEQANLFDNLAISSVFEPGSIMKPLVMAVAMDQGLVTPTTKNVFGATVTVDGHTINTALKKAYGEQTMTQVLVNSDNVAMVWVADMLGNQTMYDYLKRFGFGSKTGIDLKNEVSGRLPAVNTWRNINRATISFGQGVSVTPMQILTAYGAVANNGVTVEPHVVRASIAGDGTRTTPNLLPGVQVMKAETAKDLRNMMVAVVLGAHSRAGTEGYKVAGKTGTAQVPDPNNAGYLENQYNHSFIGMAPSDDPKYVMLTLIEQPNVEKVGQYAEGTAVPLFGRISSFLLNYYQIPPTNR